jgi:hypothetical protein
MKNKILKQLFIITGILVFSTAKAQTYDVSTPVLKFEYECHACGKKDVYYVFNSATEQKLNSKISTNCPGIENDKMVKKIVEGRIMEACGELQKGEGNPGITEINCLWMSNESPRPSVTTKGVCSQNRNSSNHDVNKNSNGTVYNLNTTITQEYINDWRKLWGVKEEKTQGASQEKNEELDKKRREFTAKFELKFADLSVGKNMVEKGDTSGVDIYKTTLFALIDMGGGIEKIDFSKEYKNSDGVVWSFRGLVADLGKLYLYNGNFEKSIKEINYLHENVDPLGERIHILLGMAYLMNCQHVKAAAVWHECKNSSYNPCEIHDKVNILVKEMREYHPDLKCIRGFKTLQVLAVIMCPK